MEDCECIGLKVTEHTDGEIAELIVYNVALDEPDQIAVQSYLRGKYVPEPATSTLLLLSGCALAMLRRKS